MAISRGRGEDRARLRVARESLRRVDQFVRLLVDSVDDCAMFALDPGRRVATWNRGAARIMGYAAEEILGENVSRFYTPEDIAAGKCEQAFETVAHEGRVEGRGWRIRKDGSRFLAHDATSAMCDEQRRLVGFARITRDLTERLRAEEHRADLASLQQASRIKDEFLATVSHELRTPLNAILGWAGILASKRQKDPETVTKAVEVIRRNAVAQAKLVEDLLDVSRITSGKMRLEVRPVDLGAIASDALEVVRPAADAKRVRLVTEGVGDNHVALMGDPARLQQVVWNLLSNAVKFTDPGGRVTLAVGRCNAGVALTVSDTGHGIDPAFAPHMFELFRQADSSATRRYGGLGLGLALVRHVVELHGGQISAESEGVGKGATFRFVLPVQDALVLADVGRQDSAHLRPARNELVRIDRVCVLVVDDDPDTRELLDELLRGRGAVPRAVGSAAEAFAVLSRERPDVIVSDMAMPEEDGCSLLHRVRALPRDAGGGTPAVALSAYGRPEDRLRALEAGFNYHIVKPVESDELVRIIRSLAHLDSLAGH